MRKLLVLLLLFLCLPPLAAAETAEDVLVIEKFNGYGDLVRQISESTQPVVDITVRPYPPDTLHKLMAEFPDRTFRYAITAYNRRRIPMDTQELDLGNTRVKSMDELNAFLSLLPKLRVLTTTNRPFTDAELTGLYETYPNLETIHCRVRVSHYIVHTDATAFSTKHDPEHERHTNEDLKALRYCHELLALDLGHNLIDDLSFLKNQPKLKVLILVDNRITDLRPVAELSDLRYLELFKNPDLCDVSPLKRCTELIDLHFGHCAVSDISELYTLTSLERLWLPANPIPQAQVDQMRALHPLCTVNNTSVKRTTGEGWRANSPHYHRILEIFERNRYLPFP